MSLPFDYVSITRKGSKPPKTIEGWLVSLDADGVGTVAALNTNTAFQLKDYDLSVITKGREGFSFSPTPPRPVTAIFTFGERDRRDGKLVARILLSNARSAEVLGSFGSYEDVLAAVLQKAPGGATGVTEYRFNKEASCL